jgi:hypothetical protein
MILDVITSTNVFPQDMLSCRLERHAERFNIIIVIAQERMATKPASYSILKRILSDA